MAAPMIVQQYLTACGACSETLAIEYSGSHGRLSDTAIRLHAFECPRCLHPNAIIVPRSAGPFRVKVVPGAGAPRPAQPPAAATATACFVPAAPASRGPGGPEHTVDLGSRMPFLPHHWPALFGRPYEVLVRLLGRQH